MFTARYGLSPYITQIYLVFKRLTEARICLWTKQLYQYRLKYIQGNITRCLMMSEPKEQYGFVRLDGPSFDELFKSFNTKFYKRNSICGSSHSQSAFIHYVTLFSYFSYFLGPKIFFLDMFEPLQTDGNWMETAQFCQQNTECLRYCATNSDFIWLTQYIAQNVNIKTWPPIILCGITMAQ